MGAAAIDVTVIVPVYNGAQTIEACIDSLLRLNYRRDSYEIVVIDNASTDETFKILQKFLPHIRVLFEPRRGPSAARNCGFRHGRGRVFALTDADCVVDPGWLAALIEPLANPAVGIVGGKILSKRPYNFVEKFGETIHDHQRAIELLEPPYVITMNWAFRADTLRQVGFFDEALLRSQDVDLAYRVSRAGYHLIYQDSAVVFHQNERTLLGLMHEGYTHGYATNAIFSKHGKWLQRRNLAQLSGLLKSVRMSLIELFLGSDRRHSLCSLCFNLGKIAGILRSQY